MLAFTIHDKNSCTEVNFDEAPGAWFLEQLEHLSVYNKANPSIKQLKADYESQFDDFELFWYSKPINQLREAGLLVL